MASAARQTRLAALVATFATLAVASLAVFTTGSSAATSCPGTIEYPFRPWADPAAYVLAEGGDFEGRTSWRVSGAKTVNGNEPYKVHRPTDSKSLSIPSGGTALSAAICVGLGDPTVRLFATGPLGSALKVEVIYETALGVVTQPVAVVAGTRGWGPTAPLPFLANVTGLASLDGLTSTVRFRFTAIGGSWKIDDVYVDPWKVT